MTIIINLGCMAYTGSNNYGSNKKMPYAGLVIVYFFLKALMRFKKNRYMAIVEPAELKNDINNVVKIFYRQYFQCNDPFFLLQSVALDNFSKAPNLMLFLK